MLWPFVIFIGLFAAISFPVQWLTSLPDARFHSMMDNSVLARTIAVVWVLQFTVLFLVLPSVYYLWGAWKVGVFLGKMLQGIT